MDDCAHPNVVATDHGRIRLSGDTLLEAPRRSSMGIHPSTCFASPTRRQWRRSLPSGFVTSADVT